MLRIEPVKASTAAPAVHSGTSGAQENEEKVARVIEEQLRTLSGIEEGMKVLGR